MAFQADSTALANHAFIHQQIAQFYRDAADQVKTHGQQVVNEFNQWDASHGGAYQNQWLNPSASDLLALADEHDQWAIFFNDLAEKVQAAENNLTGNQTPGHGPGHIQ